MSSFAVGLSLGSSFIIFKMNSLSCFEISLSLASEKGLNFSGGTSFIISDIAPKVSGSARSVYDGGNGPK